MHDNFKIKFKELDDYKFANNQKIDMCMSVVEDIEITKIQQKELHDFVELYNNDLIHQMNLVRELI